MIKIVKNNIEAIYEKYKTQFDVCLEKVPIEKKEYEKKRIVNDFIYVTSHSDFSAGEYFMYDFAHKNRIEQSEFLTEKATIEMFYRLNDKNSLDYNTRNKWKVYERLKKYYHREICLVIDLEHKDTFINFLKEKHTLFCKPLCGSLGEKTKIVKETDIYNDETFSTLLDFYKPDGFLAEEMIHQENFMMRLNPTSVNTLRIMTIRMDDRICMYFEMRIGEMFSIVDNLSFRSLICGIDHSDGTIISAFNKNRTRYINHPHTRARVVGEKIPYFTQAKDLAIELARCLPGFRYLSWDLALTDEGWVIVELNGKGGICGYQEVYNCGIRSDIERYLAELNQSTKFDGLINEGYESIKTNSCCPHEEYPFIL